MEQNNNGTEQGEKNQLVREVADKKYEYGFTTDVHTEIIERGLNEDVIRLISSKKGEPEWLLDFRLKAYRYWLTLEQPKWGHVNLPEIDYQAISYYADPTKKQKEEGSKEIDPELMKTFDKLGIPLHERLALSGVAIDAVMDSVSVKTLSRQLFRCAQQCRLLRRFLRLYSARCSLSDGTLYLFPHQRAKHGTV